MKSWGKIDILMFQKLSLYTNKQSTFYDEEQFWYIRNVK